MSYRTFSQVLMLGFAIFAMFFGAGNLVFPLVVGQMTTEAYPYAFFGLSLTAVVMPFLGLYTATWLAGCYRRFFAPLGVWGGGAAVAAILGLLGPFGVIPRCIALSQATFHFYFPYGTPWLFDVIACLMIFVLALRPSSIVTLLGKYLTPLLITILAFIIVLGLTAAPEVSSSTISPSLAGWEGLIQGYQTMDLLAALFFASFVAEWLRSHNVDELAYWRIAKWSMCLAAFLLAAVYAGFGLLAARYSDVLAAVAPAQLLGAIAIEVLGGYAGLVVCLAVCLACLTTALSLTGIFARYLADDLFRGKVSYLTALLLTVAISFGISLLEFDGIVAFLAPILSFCYPGLIALTAYNIYRVGIKESAASLWTLEKTPVTVDAMDGWTQMDSDRL